MPVARCASAPTHVAALRLACALTVATVVSSQVVEGANLFFDASARSALYEHCGLPIVKDSSANKCGVICSSLEIVASMLLSAHEFKAIKPRYVPQVLTRLRGLARLEAQMLFAEAAKDTKAALPALSERISVCILRVGLGLDVALDALTRDEQQRLFPLVMESAPPVLVELPRQGCLLRRLHQRRRAGRAHDLDLEPQALNLILELLNGARIAQSA